MKPIRADFRRGSRPPRWLWWSLAALAAAALAAGAMAGREWQLLRSLQAELRDAEARQHAMPVPQAAVVAPPVYESSARALLAERALPWPQALTSIEATAIVGVTPIGIDFSSAERSMRLEVAFSDYAKLLEYVDALNAGEPELRWALAQSQSQAMGAATALIVATPVAR
jgi:hypothetical protein